MNKIFRAQLKRDTWYEVTNPVVAALDGQLKHEDTNLASSTLIHDPTQKENLGIIVQYKVRQGGGGKIT